MTVDDASALQAAVAELTGLVPEGQLGRGAHTSVQVMSRGERRYAVKQQCDAADETAVLLSFRREAALLAGIDHPGILRACATGLHDGRAALVTELVPGRPLADLLADGPLSETRALRLGTELAGALAAAHRTGLVHRDLKPQNIIVPAESPAVIVDFGLAARGGEPGAEHTAVGTFDYTAPEQTGMLQRPVDGRSDLYSLGVVLFECLTGQPPFSAPDVGELLRMHAVAVAPDVRSLRPGIGPAFADVVARLLAKDPDDRFRDARDLLRALHRCAGDAASDLPPAELPLVGRGRELAALTARRQAARAGAGGMALVRGPAGAGRSRLVAELCEPPAGRPGAGSGLVLHARCSPDVEAPMAAIRTAVERYLAHVDRLDPAERDAARARLRRAAAVAGAALIRTVSPALSALLSDVPQSPSDGRDERLAAAVAVFLAELALEHGGGVVVLDDAHRLDPAGHRVLTALTARLARTPLLVVLTAPDGADPSALQAACGTALDTTVALAPLTEAETAALVASRLPGAAVPADLTAHVAARSGGLPLAVVEYLRDLADRGLLVPHWGDWWLDVDRLHEIPAGDDRGPVVARLDGLAPRHRTALAVAAVAGVRFRFDVVAAASGLPPERVAAAVGAAVVRGLVESGQDGRYAFVHPALRDALLAGLDTGETEWLHRRIAEALEELAPEARDVPHAYTVAYHYGCGGPDVDPEVLYRSAVAAGRQALADRAPGDAVGYLERAREAAARTGRPLPTDVAHALALGYLRTGRFDDARAELRTALAAETEPAARAGLWSTVAELEHAAFASTAAIRAATQALAELGHPLPRRRLALLLSTLGSGILAALIRRTGIGAGGAREEDRADLERRAMLLNNAAYGAAAIHHVGRSMTFALRALLLANRLGPGPAYARAYGLLGYLLGALKLRRPGRRCAERAADAARAVADPALTAYVDWLRGMSEYVSGANDGQDWERSIHRHARWLDPPQFLTSYGWIGIRQLLRGYAGKSQAAYRRGLSLLPPGTAWRSADYFSLLGVLTPALQGRPAEAARALAAIREAVPADTAAWQRADIVVAQMCALTEQGEFGVPFEAAIAEFEAIGLHRTELTLFHHWFYVFKVVGRLNQCRLAGPAGRPARLAAARGAVRELGRVARTPLVKAVHQLTRASLLEQSGRPEAAIRLAERTERRSWPLDAPVIGFDVARVRARALRRLGHDAEAERQARYAYQLAETYGWEHRTRAVRAEFGIDVAGTSRRYTRTDTGTTAGDPRSNRRLEALQQVSVAAATVLDPDELARVALDETLHILGAERALLFMVDDDGELRRFAGRDAAGDDLDAVTDYGSTLIGRVRETGQAVVVTGTEQGAALGSQSVVAHGLRSIIVAPVLLKGRLTGVVYLDSRLARGIFTDADADVLTAVVSHVAVALETARAAQLDVMVRTARRQREVAELLRTSLVELSALLDPGQVLDRLFHTLAEQSGATGGCLLRADGESLSVVATSGAVGGDRLGARFGAARAPGSVLDAVAKAGVPAAGPVPDGLHGLVEAGPAALTVPLVARDQLVGVVLLAGAAFDDACREVAAALASQGVSAYENARLFTQVQELATTDGLTGVANRRHFHGMAEKLVSVARRNKRELTAIMLDIDHFKQVNDTHGHGAGDDVIREVARRLGASVRDSDVLGRYGGEEFAAVLPEYQGPDPLVAERMRAAVAAGPIPTRAGPVRVTISVGVARLSPGDDGLDALLARADHALYRAKKGGRNRVVLA
ncbi:diguanylate cyclase [Planomonospora venezuelensis]|uniref:diguanylate cyclase n=1 Tax=Planomonospora venezuelensis TaxID=1999 RepID=UPI001C86A95F